MEIFSVLLSKPVLIGAHLGLAILGIDAFLWLLGQLRGKGSNKSMIVSASIGTAAFVLSWIVGGFYYVEYYGGLVKPVIKEGVAPWAHIIVMETKEHIFLFVVPLAVLSLLLVLVGRKDLKRLKLMAVTQVIIGMTAGIGLLIGLMGFIISAAARWGA